jgi:tetratricopeptide (TPR) repeat protein
MPSVAFLLMLLLSVSVAIGSAVNLYWIGFKPSAGGDFVELVFGDSRRMFADHFFRKADVYFHSGYYPTIFDETTGTSAMARPGAQWEDAGDSASASKPAERGPAEGHDHDHDHDHDHGDAEEDELRFLKPPADWIDAFGRHFYPTEHSHLDEGTEKEMLPWLRLSASLDPQRVKTYTVASFWLRKSMNRVTEAEQFLREGWRANPHSHEIIFELGRLFSEDKNDPVRARNLWDLAIQEWQKQESVKEEPDFFALQQMLGHLALLDQKEGHFDRAIHHFELLKRISPRPEEIQKRIEEIRVLRDGSGNAALPPAPNRP